MPTSLHKKCSLFEYLVYRLVEKGGEFAPDKELDLSKLRLQKILFFVASFNATKGDHPLLDIFNEFYALPYGPVESDLYNAMNNPKAFKHISFNGNQCQYNDLMTITPERIIKSPEDRALVDNAIKSLSPYLEKYLTAPVFDIVEITHKWSVWQVAMRYAEIMDRHSEKMSINDICSSTIKAYE